MTARPGGGPGEAARPGGGPGDAARPGGGPVKAAGLSPSLIERAREVVALYPEPRSALVPLCHLAQSEEGWLSPEAMTGLAELVGVTPAEVLGTASFYDMLHTEPVGRYLIGVCTNIACLLEGGEELLGHAEERLGIRTGGTTPDRRFTLEEVECVALCDRAPCATVNWRFFGPLTNEAFDALVDDLGAGRLDAEVPRHGVLCRVRREGGLAVGPGEVAAERAASDRAIAEREAAREAATKDEAAREAATKDAAAREAATKDAGAKGGGPGS
ncbi:MAG: NAD(P)H-dependent oxidoreductase subunit E [Acidimicrobiales bacterium]